MMAKFSKSFVIKTSILLITVLTVVSLLVGVTHGRYLTESNHDIGFKANLNSPILLGDTAISERTLIPLSNWDVGVEQINNHFTLKCSPEAQDESFYIGVFVENKSDDSQTETVETVETVEQTEEQAIEITLNFDGNTYTTTAREVEKNADFYLKNEKNGKLYSFYDNADTSPEPIENVFIFPMGEETTLDFTLNVYNADINLSDNIFIFIQRLK